MSSNKIKQLQNEIKKLEIRKDSDTGGAHGMNIIRYSYSKLTPGKGRRYANQGQQWLWRKVRHTLARKIYYDLDIVNCQATLMFQYCKKNNNKNSPPPPSPRRNYIKWSENNKK
jgi:hypothetical protein